MNITLSSGKFIVHIHEIKAQWTQCFHSDSFDNPSLCQIHGMANDLKTAVDRLGKCVIFYRPCNEFKIYWLYIRAEQEQGINLYTYAHIIDDSTTLERIQFRNILFFPSMSSAVFHWFSQTWLRQDFQIFLPGCFCWLNVLIITDNLSDLSVLISNECKPSGSPCKISEDKISMIPNPTNETCPT